MAEDEKQVQTYEFDKIYAYDFSVPTEQELEILKKAKARYWRQIVYPESAPDDWREELCALGIPFAVSPLHDCDVVRKEDVERNYQLILDSLKKPHYHVLYDFGSPTTWKNVTDIFRHVTNGSVIFKCDSPKGMLEYFVHKNNPEKHQYDEKDIQCYCGFDYDYYMSKLSPKEVNQTIREIQSLIVSNRITEYSELLDTLMLEYDDKYYDVAISHTLVLDKFITSFRHNPRKVADVRARIRGEVVDWKAIEIEQHDLALKKAKGLKKGED